ncbi:MAG TPA: hypothetical protein PLB02_13445 [Thermoanaerobaculia bacterium]|nr:hypothetical protein [Thermoanaerobaculia bacterium]HQR68388.1 hypothetical protein [Thermoanaerobaculia bacterium]
MDETQGVLQLVATATAREAQGEGERVAASEAPAADGWLLGLLALQAAAFALAGASGKIPAAVITLFRALLTF